MSIIVRLTRLALRASRCLIYSGSFSKSPSAWGLFILQGSDTRDCMLLGIRQQLQVAHPIY